MTLRLFFILLIHLAPVALVARAEDAIQWRHLAQANGISLSANPLTEDARTAFYLARGFTAASIQPYARRCGFSIGMQNGSETPIRTSLADWRVVDAAGQQIPLNLPANWDAEWAKASIAPPARLAFRWAQFQADNDLAPGDWIMGMATLDGEPMPPFRLIAAYHDDNGDHDLELDALVCARD